MTSMEVKVGFLRWWDTVGFINTVFGVIAGLPCSVGPLASTSLSLPSSSTLHRSHAPSTHLLEGLHTGGKNAFIQGLHGDYIVIF